MGLRSWCRVTNGKATGYVELLIFVQKAPHTRCPDGQRRKVLIGECLGKSDCVLFFSKKWNTSVIFHFYWTAVNSFSFSAIKRSEVALTIMGRVNYCRQCTRSVKERSL